MCSSFLLHTFTQDFYIGYGVISPRVALTHVSASHANQQHHNTVECVVQIEALFSILSPQSGRSLLAPYSPHYSCSGFECDLQLLLFAAFSYIRWDLHVFFLIVKQV